MAEVLLTAESAEARPAHSPGAAQKLGRILERIGFEAGTYARAISRHAPPALTMDEAVASFVARGVRRQVRFPLGTDMDAALFAADEMMGLDIEDDHFRTLMCSVVLRNSFLSFAASLPQKRGSVWNAISVAQAMRLTSGLAIPIFVLGDSHSRLLTSSPISKDGRWLMPISRPYYGASARGLINDGSHLQYGRAITDFYSVLEPHVRRQEAALFFHFGQVDVEFVYAFKRAKSASKIFDWEDFRRFSEASVDLYFEFLRQLVPHDLRSQVYICSVLPPVLSDDTWRRGYIRAGWPVDHEVANASREELAREVASIRELQMPDLAERTTTHQYFNGLMESGAAAANFGFLNGAEVLLAGKKTLDPMLSVRGGGKDCHIDYNATALNRMTELIFKALA